MNENIPYIIISLLFSAFFSGAEIAFISVDKFLFELDRQKGKLSGKIITGFIKSSSHFIGTMLLGNTMALVVYGISVAYFLEPFLFMYLPLPVNNSMVTIIVQALISSLILVFTSEFLSKSIFYINPHRFLSMLAVPILLVYYLLHPLVYIMVGISKFIVTRILRLEFSDDNPVFGLTDLNNFIQSRLKEKNKRNVIDLDAKIFANALEFKTVRVRECMIPRTEIRAVELNDGIDALKKEFVESGFSKILVYRDSIDEIIGFCHTLELFKKPGSIQEILTPVHIIPETMQANELLVQFITERKSIALVVDEFGGTSGIVTIEDLIEEIFGEIEDEHDEQNLVEQKLDPYTFLLSARLEIDYLNEKYEWKIPHGDYDTLGGFILSATEDMPSLNEDIQIPPFSFHIVSMEENRINLVKMMFLGKND